MVASTSPFIMKLKRIRESIKAGGLLSVRISGLPDCLRGLLVGRSLVEFALRYCQVLIELAKPRQIAGGQLQHSRGRDQSGLGLQEIGACRW
jgi:hypothetical protein